MKDIFENDSNSEKDEKSLKLDDILAKSPNRNSNYVHKESPENIKAKKDIFSVEEDQTTIDFINDLKNSDS